MALSPEQRKIRDRIVAVGRKRGATVKEIKAALETGLVESNLRNLSGGDADSAGWRQERASIYKDPTNLDASINRFFTETAAVRDKYATAGALAAAVQRPAAQYRGRYQQRAGEAQALLGGAGKTGGGMSPGSDTTTTTTTTPGVDNSAARAQLIQSFLEDRKADPIDLALGVRQLQDVAPTRSSKTTTTPGTPRDTSDGVAMPDGKSPLLELIHSGGSGYAVKNGKLVDPSVYSAVWAGHKDHVHVAAGPKTVVELGKLAQKMGLRVGENPHFGGVAPVHVPGSYHFKGEAIDVSGDPSKMAAYAAAVERAYKLKR